MLVKTILNRVQKFPSFVYGDVRFAHEGTELCLEVDIVPRINGRVRCSGCHRRRPVYDTMKETRRFEFVPLWNIPVWLLYRMRRVKCKTCGVRVEAVPWANGKQRRDLGEDG
ncbi:MAG: transposase family protein [bacterium]|nr:transposase family protein [bacterium]